MAYSETNNISIAGIAAAVPESILDLDSLKSRFGREEAEAAMQRYGTRRLHVSPPEQTAADLGYVAASRIIEKKKVDPRDIGAIVFVSRTPDYRSPATAIVLNYRLGLSIDCVSYDLVLGCNGFINGLQAVSSLLANINKPYAMLITGDTTSKQLSESNPLSLFYGDGAAAILLEKKEGSATIAVEAKADGDGFRTMILPGGGFRFNKPLDELKEGMFKSSWTFNELNLDEQAFQNFVLSEVPGTIKGFLLKRKANFGDFDFLAFQQVGSSLIEKLAGVLGLSPEALPANISEYGNTSGSSIPLLLCDKLGNVENKTEIKVLATAFGEGLSWGVTDFMIYGSNVLPVIETNDFFREGDVDHNF